jgi:hypothetical protein
MYVLIMQFPPTEQKEDGNGRLRDIDQKGDEGKWKSILKISEGD